MKPFTPIISKHIADEKTRFYVYTKRNEQEFWIESFTRYDSHAHALDRKTAEWLCKQLKKALKVRNSNDN